VLLASREHAHDMLLVSVLVSEVELKLSIIELATALEKYNDYTGLIKANFHSGKLSVDWNGQEHFS
jgi:hypothetical protein